MVSEVAPIDATVPGDLSSAAFFLCATLLFPESNLILDSIGMNPTRASLLDVIAALGGRIKVLNVEEQHGELIGTIQVNATPGGFIGTTISGALSAQIIDELPVLAAIAPYTRDGITIRDAKELRVKESDRIALVAQNLRAMGAELTEFEVTRILFQLLMARLIEQAPEEEVSRAVFLDVEDEPELLRIVTTYNNMFAMLYESLADAAGVEGARGLFMEALESTASGELWTGVSFDQDGRFDENMLIGNISELPFERRKGALEDGLNTLLSVQLFEVSQHLDAAGQSDVFQFISAQKALLETTA